MPSEKLKKQLISTLEDHPDDIDKIIFLSNQISKADESRVRFSVDAGVIDRLGRELVARQETAVSELVKNSYDADSTIVNLTFIKSNDIGGTLVIEDNGDGMDKNQLINGFMRISSTDKIKNPISNKYCRGKAGQKGIGRFAVQRLGEKLTIITQTKESRDALKLSINWNDYEGDIDLSSVGNKLEVVPKESEEGTKLVIERLRDKWSEAAIRRVYRYVADILQPFNLTIGNSDSENIVKVDNNGCLDDPGFQVVFSQNNGEEGKIIADDSKMIYDYALAEINGYLGEDGIGYYTLESEKLDLNIIDQLGSDPDNNTIPFSELLGTNVQFKAYYYIYDSSLIPRSQMTTLKRLGRRSGGIRLYRNGFRVLPYGEEGDDWINLDASTTKRSILPVHANINFFGFVQIKDPDKKFNETSSREGLVENEALIQLKNYLYRSIISAVIKVAEVRNVKLVSGQQKDQKGRWDYDSVDVRIKNIAFTLDKLEEALENEKSGVETKKKRKRNIQNVKKEIKELQNIRKKEQKKLLEEKSTLRVLK